MTPYVPDQRPGIVILTELASSGFTAAPTQRTRAQITTIEPHTGTAICDTQMTATHRAERGKYGRRSPTRHQYPCQRRAIQTVTYDDGTTTHRCKEHRIA